MSLKDNTLQQQLKRAQTHLSDIEQTLAGGVPKKNAMWRRAQARVQQIEGRLSARAARHAPVATGSAAEAESAEE